MCQLGGGVKKVRKFVNLVCERPLPIPSPSASSWPELGKFKQLSSLQCGSRQGNTESGNPSESESGPQIWPLPAKPVSQTHNPLMYDELKPQLAKNWKALK